MAIKSFLESSEARGRRDLTYGLSAVILCSKLVIVCSKHFRENCVHEIFVQIKRSYFV